MLTVSQDYLTDVAQKYGLYKHARFHSSVEEACWNDKTLKWEVMVTVGGGKESEFTSSYQLTTDFLVAATGQLNKPKGIDIPGYQDYQGKIMHSARWDWSFDMKGKRIAVIGTGKSFCIAGCHSHPNPVQVRRQLRSSQKWRSAHLSSPSARERRHGSSRDMTQTFPNGSNHCSPTFRQLANELEPKLWISASRSTPPSRSQTRRTRT